MNIKNLTPLSQRIIISGGCIAVLFAAVYFSFTPLLGLLFPLLATAITGFAVREYYTIARAKKLSPHENIGTLLSIVIALSFFLSTQAPLFDFLPIFVLWLAVLTVFVSYFLRGEDPFINVAVTLFGIFYLTIPVGCAIQINYFFQADSSQDGRWWLFYLLAITYLSDSSALFIGKAFGRQKLAPFISPKKTWEGAIGSFAFSVLCSIVFAYFANHSTYSIPMQITYFESIVLGAILSILAQLGDLCESLLKRDAGVKDSSKIPGIGGMLDAIDSLVFTAPLVYLFLRYQPLH